MVNKRSAYFIKKKGKIIAGAMSNMPVKSFITQMERGTKKQGQPLTVTKTSVSKVRALAKKRGTYRPSTIGTEKKWISTVRIKMVKKKKTRRKK